MEPSLFIQYVEKYFPGIAARVVTSLNGTTNPNAITYLHRNMLRKQYSTNLKWESIINANNNIVAADVIAMDSSLPLKKRDSISRANGDIPKMGMELALRERELTDLDILSRTPGQLETLIARIFQDTPRVINGIYERLEYEFLLGLSTGVSVVTDANNVGTGIRVDYGYLAANKFGVSKVWSDPTSTPFTDISKRAEEKANADGNNITVYMLDKATFDNIAKTGEAKDLFANSIGVFQTGTNVPIPTLDQLNTAARNRFGYTFQIVDRSVTIEKNGVRTRVKPWAAGAVVGLTNTQVGTLTYGTLAEMNHPVNNVAYTTVDDYILVSKFRLNRPSLSEHTTSQALVLPVIEGVDGIYLIDSTTVQA